MQHLWMGDPRPMNDEWLAAEIDDITLMLEYLERQQRHVACERQAYRQYVGQLET